MHQACLTWLNINGGDWKKVNWHLIFLLFTSNNVNMYNILIMFRRLLKKKMCSTSVKTGKLNFMNIEKLSFEIL